MAPKQSPKPVRGVFERVPGSGQWWIRYVDANGKLHREAIGPRPLAIKMHAVRKAEVAEGRHLPGRRNARVSEAVDGYLGSLSATAGHKDAARYAEFWRAALGESPLRTVTGPDVDRAIAPKRAAVSDQTVYHYLAFLRSTYSWAIKAKWIEGNPVRDARWPKLNNARVRYLLDEEETRLRAQVPAHHWPVVAFAMYTGLRASEQWGLTWGDVDMRAATVTVRKSKSGKARHVELNDTSLAILRKLPRSLTDDRVFTVNQRNFVKRVFDKAVDRAGIENFRWHDLRHTFASRLAIIGVDLREIMELLGHASLTMTMRYAHLAPGARRRAVKHLNGWHERTVANG